MNNYEYIIASLPVISSDFRGELDYEGILEQIREQLSEKDLKFFSLLLDGFNPDKLNEDFYKQVLKCPNAFIKGYFLYDLNVRNVRVRFINQNLGRPSEEDVLNILPEDYEFEDEEKVRDILNNSDILGRERALDDLMWAKAEELCGLQVFSADCIYAFIAKLQIVARWLKLDPQTGRQLFKQLVEEIRNNKKNIIE
ncbi:MAG TPA: hypothetical protein DHU75_08250 [Rikenellaceae bacterium]|nr:hypothetical protein [Rikenellaceae bacterium]